MLISVFVFGKRKINRNLAKISVIPTIFNISDVLIYGFPAIYNFYLLAPFIVTPALAYCLSYGAFKFNIVPRIDETIQISETTPVFISGYQLTGSYKGVLLQLIPWLSGENCPEDRSGSLCRLHPVRRLLAQSKLKYSPFPC